LLNFNDYKVLIIGRGRLGASLKKKIKCANILSRSEVDSLVRDENVTYLEDTFEHKLLVFNTAAITNPHASYLSINDINFERSLRLHQKLTKDSFFISFGTVTEKTLLQNNYIDSKRRINEYLSGHENAQHFMLHTLYGEGLPVPHMFLGQIFQSIRTKSLFKMSQGAQYREYQNIHSVVDELLHRLTNSITEPVVTFGNPIQLKSLASLIMRNFGLGELLDIGVDSASADEIFEKHIFNRNTSVFHPDVKVDICRYLEKLL
jgi:hypothetical protein